MRMNYKSTQQVFIILIAMLLVVGCGSKSSEVNLIPQPLELKINSGNFIISEYTKIIVDSKDPKVKEIAQYFVEQFNNASGYSIKIITSSENNDANKTITFNDENLDTSLSDEGYKLICDEDAIVISGNHNGLFYGVQTLFQLLPDKIFSTKTAANINWYVPSVEIVDKPRFKWRGMHLDVGRHMYPVSFIKKYIDYIAMHKLNIFHWHLTEDQGWRIEIKKYPRLTEIGAWRKGTLIGNTDKVDNQRYGGFYTQDKIREIVAYAENKFVTVIPEIELPGHSVAALAAYPEFSCTGGPFEVRTEWGIADDIYCAGNDAVFTYLEDVLSEVLELFPSKYIHIGGDEAPKKRWEKCLKCQNRIKKEGLIDEDGLQNYFISRIEKFLNSKGRQIIGWNEIMEGGLAPNAAVMSWQGIEGGISAAKLKHPVVMTPQDYLYFDNYGDKPENEPLAFEIVLPIEKVYNFEPISDELDEDEQKYIMGVQACLWSTYITTPELAEYMMFPRLCALSEIAWSAKKKRNFEDFLDRMNGHYGRLDELDVNYRWPKIEGFKNKNVFIDKTKVEFISKLEGAEIRYTLDGTTPSKSSILYTNPIVVSENVKIKLKEVTSNRGNSPVYIAEYVKKKPIKAIRIKDIKKGVKFQYFEFIEPINSAAELLQMKPVSNGIIEKFVYPLENEKLPKQFGLIYNGFIKIPTEDVYTFSVLSNDGSCLYIADQLVVNNDGSHRALEREGEIPLKTGLHKIELLYFQAGGDKMLKVFMKNNRNRNVEIIENIYCN